MNAHDYTGIKGIFQLCTITDELKKENYTYVEQGT